MTLEELLKRIKFLALSDLGNLSEGNYPAQILIAKYGKNNYRKGNDKGEFEFTEKDADKLISVFSEKSVEMMIDYEHQSLIKGQEAPASGWINKLVKTDQGLVAVVKEWTEKAKTYFKNKEYKYYSPVILFDKEKPSRLFNVALTNTPSLDNIEALIASELFSIDSNNNNKKGEAKMLKELLKKLGLLALSDKPEDEQTKAVVNEIGKLVDESKKVEGFLKLHECDSLDAVTGKIQGMVSTEDKTKLELEIKKRDANDAVAVAMSEGKISDGFKDWAVDFATRDLKAFKEWTKDAPKIVPDGGNTDQNDGDNKDKKPDDQQVKILSEMGYSDEEIKKIIAEEVK